MLAYLDRSGCSIFYTKEIVSGLKVCYTSITYRGARPSCIFGCRPLSGGREYDLGKSTRTTFRLHCHCLPLCANNLLNFHGPIDFSPHLQFLLLDMICNIHTFYMSTPYSWGRLRRGAQGLRSPLFHSLIWPMDSTSTNSTQMVGLILEDLQNQLQRISRARSRIQFIGSEQGVS